MSSSAGPSPAPARRYSAVLLAAGPSTRMGERNKLLLPYRGSTFIQRMVEVLLASRLDEVVVVLGHAAGRVRPLLEGAAHARPLVVVEHPDYGEGMGSSRIRCFVVEVANRYGVTTSNVRLLLKKRGSPSNSNSYA